MCLKRHNYNLFLTHKHPLQYILNKKKKKQECSVSQCHSSEQKYSSLYTNKYFSHQFDKVDNIHIAQVSLDMSTPYNNYINHK